MMTTIDEISELVANIDFGVLYQKRGRAERARLIKEDRKSIGELAEDRHLALRAIAAYCLTESTYAETLVEDADDEVMDRKIGVRSASRQPVAIDVPQLAKVDREGRTMPIVSLLRTVEHDDMQQTRDGATTKARKAPRVVAIYRYNPRADKLQRIG
jgi:hypothetical protein